MELEKGAVILLGWGLQSYSSKKIDSHEEQIPCRVKENKNLFLPLFVSDFPHQFLRENAVNY